MIEGLILLTELASMVLLLWTVQRRDTPGARSPTNLFAYRDPDHPAKGDVSQGRSRSQRDA
ncbi:MAG: hypothetical protein ACK41V_14900 [Acidovorax sp.]|uniref:hypothetical protein n=1 Tax=Acidovorax sp. TaxID=1872122 RepID=UPI00391B407A